MKTTVTNSPISPRLNAAASLFAKILAGLLILSSTTAFSGLPQNTLYFYGPKGDKKEIPLKPEVAEELPAEIKDIYIQIHDSLVNHQFDVSLYSRPEQEVNDLVIDTRAIYLEVLAQARKSNTH